MADFIPPPEDELRDGEKLLDPELTPQEQEKARRAQLILLIIMWVCIILPFVLFLLIYW